MTNPINGPLLAKLRNKEPLTEEEQELILENEEFLEVLLTWLHYDEFKHGYAIGDYNERFIDKEDTNEYITEYLDKRDIN